MTARTYFKRLGQVVLIILAILTMVAVLSGISVGPFLLAIQNNDHWWLMLYGIYFILFVVLMPLAM